MITTEIYYVAEYDVDAEKRVRFSALVEGPFVSWKQAYYRKSLLEDENSRPYYQIVKQEIQVTLA